MKSYEEFIETAYLEKKEQINLQYRFMFTSLFKANIMKIFKKCKKKIENVLGVERQAVPAKMQRFKLE